MPELLSLQGECPGTFFFWVVVAATARVSPVPPTKTRLRCGGCAVDISHLIAHHECITTRDSKRYPESGTNVWNPPSSLISSFLISFSHFVLIFLYSPALLDPHHIHALPCRVLTEKQ